MSLPASRRDEARVKVEGAQRAPPPQPASISHSTRRNNIPGIEVLVRLDGDGGTPQRTRASIGPYRVARARTPRALYRTMAADGLVPRHGGGGGVQGVSRGSGPRGRREWWWGLLAQSGRGRLLHRGGTAARGVQHGRRSAAQWARQRRARRAARRGGAGERLGLFSGGRQTAGVGQAMVGGGAYGCEEWLTTPSLTLRMETGMGAPLCYGERHALPTMRHLHPLQPWNRPSTTGSYRASVLAILQNTTQNTNPERRHPQPLRHVCFRQCKR